MTIQVIRDCVMWRVAAFILCFVSEQYLCATSPNQSQEAYDVSYLSCWQGRDQTDFASRHKRTAVLISRGGAKAFGEVVAKTVGVGWCQNTTTLFASEGKTKFRNVYQVTPVETQDGNGIRLVAWSPDGRKLLTEITDWAYGSDAGLGKLVVIYDAIKKDISELPVYPQLIDALGDKCDFWVFTERWISDAAVLLKVKKQPYCCPEKDERRDCLPTTTHLFRLDTKTGQLSPL